MAKMYVTEYANQAIDRHGQPVAAGECPDLGTFVLDHTAGVITSARLNAKTRLIRLHADSICSVNIADGTPATTNHKRMVAGQTEYFGITPEARDSTLGVKVSVITNT